MSEFSTPGVTFGQLKRLIEVAESGGTRDDDMVVLAKDSEGNSFSPLATWSNDAIYRADSSYAGDLEHWDEDDVEDRGPDREAWEEWYLRAQEEGGFRCLVLWPTN